MFCVSDMCGDLRKMFKSIKVGLILLVSFPVISGMESKCIKSVMKIIVSYKINANVDKLRVLGGTFVNNNIGKVEMFVNSNNCALCDVISVDKLKSINGFKNNTVKVEFRFLYNYTGLSYMFYGCDGLYSIFLHIPFDRSRWFTNMRCMFAGCKLLSNLPVIPSLYISRVTDMGYMFNGCESLRVLPNISKWSTNKVTYMSGMFEGCISLMSEIK